MIVKIETFANITPNGIFCDEECMQLYAEGQFVQCCAFKNEQCHLINLEVTDDGQVLRCQQCRDALIDF